MRRVGWALLGLYVVACGLSFMMLALSTYRSPMFEPTAWAGLLALMLALPWSVVLAFFARLSPLLSAIVLAVGMGLNVALWLAILRNKAL